MYSEAMSQETYLTSDNDRDNARGMQRSSQALAYQRRCASRISANASRKMEARSSEACL